MADPIHHACPECGHPIARVHSTIQDESCWECEGPVVHRFGDLQESPRSSSSGESDDQGDWG